jgi:hypothetical protein
MLAIQNSYLFFEYKLEYQTTKAQYLLKDLTFQVPFRSLFLDGPSTEIFLKEALQPSPCMFRHALYIYLVTTVSNKCFLVCSTSAKTWLFCSEESTNPNKKYITTSLAIYQLIITILFLLFSGQASCRY